MRVKALSTTLALTLALAAFTGAAFANDGGNKGKSDQTPAAANPTPPVQRSQGGTPAQAKSESKGRSDDSKRQSKGQESKGQSALAHHHVIVCHRTGSDSNPYVVINIPLTAWTNAHSPETGSHPVLNGRHDILLKDPASRPGSKDGFTKASCGSTGTTPVDADVKDSKQSSEQSEQSSEKSEDCSGKKSGQKIGKKSKCGENAAAPTAKTTQSCAAVTTVTTIVGGVWHKTGAFKDGKPKYVLIRPSKKSAHYDASKHPDDIIVADRTVTTTTSAAENCDAAPVTITTTKTPAVAATANPTAILSMVAAKTASTARGANPAPASAPAGVAGATFKGSPKGASTAKPVGGVLGATARLGKPLGRAAGGTLPVTGIPLWIAALLGLALLGGGLALRRGAASSSTTL